MKTTTTWRPGSFVPLIYREHTPSRYPTGSTVQVSLRNRVIPISPAPHLPLRGVPGMAGR